MASLLHIRQNKMQQIPYNLSHSETYFCNMTDDSIIEKLHVKPTMDLHVKKDAFSTPAPLTPSQSS